MIRAFKSLAATSIPDGWRLARLGDVAVNPRGAVSGPFGSNIGSRHYVPYGVPVIRGNNLPANSTGRRFIDGSFVFLTADKAEELAASECLPHDLVFTARGTIGQVGLIPIEARYSQYIASANQLRLRADLDIAYPLYLYFWCSSGHMLKTMQAHSTSTGVPNMNLGSLKGLPLLLPPLPEQRAIANILDSIDQAIEATDALVSATEQLRDSLLHILLTRGLPGRHTEWKEVPGLGTIPSDWEIAKLGDVVDVRSGQADPRDPKYQGYLFVAPDDIQSATGRLLGRRSVGSARAISGKYEFDRHDVVYSKIRPYLMKVFLPQEQGLCSADMYPIAPRKRLGREFLALVLLSSRFTAYTRTCSDRTGIPKINRHDLLKYVLPLPPASEQKTIAAIFNSIDESLEKGRGAGEGLRKLKESASDALLTGRMRVRVPER